ncbi:MAG: hypothetical protein GY854_20950 [Deltaproteobacteria bacterium]|nr:hypothetical protein [Deltaproteobacteria bacterium]
MLDGKSFTFSRTALIACLAALLISVGIAASVIGWKRHLRIRDEMSAAANASGDSHEIIQMESML